MRTRFGTLSTALLLAVTASTSAAAWEVDYSTYIRGVARLDLTGPARSGTPETGALHMVGQGDHLYLATRHAGILVVDATDPLNLELVGDAAPSSWIRSLALQDDVLYANFLSPEVSLFDVSTPESPTLLGTFEASNARQLALRPETGPASTVFVAAWDDIVIADVTDPTTPVVVATIPGDRSTDVAYQNGYLYVANQLDDSWVFDVSDPADPVLVGTFESSTGLEVVGQTLYSLRGSFFQHWDISDPTSMTRLSHVNLHVTVREITVLGDLVFVASDRAGLTVLDLSGPAAVVGGAPVPAYGEATAVVARGDHAFVSVTTGYDEWGYVLVVDVTNPTSPDPIGWAETNSYAEDLAIAGGIAYVPTDRSGLYLMDVSGGVPSRLGIATGFGSAEQVDVRPPAAYVLNRDRPRFHVIDVSDPTQPTFDHTVLIGHEATDVFVSGSYAFLLGPSHMTVFDVSDPLVPALFSETTFSEFSNAQSMDVVDGIAYLAGWGGPVMMLDVSQPDAPSFLTSFSAPAFNVRVRDGLLFAGCNDSGLWILDVSDPASPSLVTVVSDFRTWRVDVDGDYVYAGGWYSGLNVVDVSDPFHPAVLGGVATPPDVIGHVQAVGVHGGAVHLAWYRGGADGGLTSVPLQTPNPVPAPSLLPAPARFSLEAARPNPFREATTLAFSLRSPGSAKLRVYDVTGRIVRELTRASLPAGRHELRWDGLDREGRSVGTGIYFVRLEAGGRQSVRKVQRLR